MALSNSLCNEIVIERPSLSHSSFLRLLQARSISAIRMSKLDRKLVSSASVFVGYIIERSRGGFWRVNRRPS